MSFKINNINKVNEARHTFFERIMTYGQYLLLGTNLGDKLANLERAKKAISKVVCILSTSSVYETAAWGVTDQPSFYNQVLKVNSKLDPEVLLQHLLQIETDMGRMRYEKWGPRVIDIDILYLDNMIIQINNLQVPHPGIIDRKFTLVPLVELAPDFIHPLNGMSNEELLINIKDDSKIKKLPEVKAL